MHTEVLKGFERHWDQIPRLTQEEWEKIRLVTPTPTVFKKEQKQIALFEDE